MAAYTEYTGPPMSTQGVPVGPQWQERMATQHFDASPAPPAAAAVVPDGSNNFYADVLAAAKAGSEAQVQAARDFKAPLPNIGESTDAVAVVEKAELIVCPCGTAALPTVTLLASTPASAVSRFVMHSYRTIIDVVANGLDGIDDTDGHVMLHALPVLVPKPCSAS